MINVEVVYIPKPGLLFQCHLSLEEGATIAQALTASGILEGYPEINTYDVGIFSRKANRQTQLKMGDRIEVYRPLTIDPKEKRRHRAGKKI